MTTAEIPVAYGIVVTDIEGRIQKFLEKPSWSQVFSDKINAGIYILDPQAIEYIPKDSKYDFSKQLFPNILADGKNIYGYHLKNNYWLDIGDPEKFIQADTGSCNNNDPKQPERPEQKNKQPGCRYGQSG